MAGPAECSRELLELLRCFLLDTLSMNSWGIVMLELNGRWAELKCNCGAELSLPR